MPVSFCSRFDGLGCSLPLLGKDVEKWSHQVAELGSVEGSPSLAKDTTLGGCHHRLLLDSRRPLRKMTCAGKDGRPGFLVVTPYGACTVCEVTFINGLLLKRQRQACSLRASRECLLRHLLPLLEAL